MRSPWCNRYLSFLGLTLFLSVGWILGSACALAEEDNSPFTIVLMPDTQLYTVMSPVNNPYSIQTQWIKDNVESENIKFVIHLGDIVENRNSNPNEWQIASDAHGILEQVPDPVPYSMIAGNHDIDGSGDPNYIRNSTLYNDYFGPERFSGKEWYGGHMGTTNDNNFTFFSAGGTDFMVLSLELLPRDSTIAWANNVVQSHPDHQVIVATHRYLQPDGTRSPYRIYGGVQGNNGTDIFDKLVKGNDNVFMTVSGHVGPEGLNIATNDYGNPVYEILSDYQGLPNGGNGWLRTLKFDPQNEMITVGSYSPVLDQYNFENGTYTLPINYGTSVPPPPPTTGLMKYAHWKFDLPAGGSEDDGIVSDTDAVMGLAATVKHGYSSTATDVKYGAASSDGGTASADLNNTVAGTNDTGSFFCVSDDDIVTGHASGGDGFTCLILDAMIDPESFPFDSNYVIYKFNNRDSGGWETSNGYYLNVRSNGEVRFQIGTSTGYARATSAAGIIKTDGGWYHLRGVWDGTDMSLYIDDMETPVATAAFSGTLENTAGALSIGCILREGDGTILNGSGSYFDGRIDEVQIWGDRSPGDLNSDGFVGGDDLDIVRSHWGQNVPTGDLLQGDPSEDGFVGGDDLDIVRANWGQGTPPAPTSVPEPAMIVLLISGLMLGCKHKSFVTGILSKT